MTSVKRGTLLALLLSLFLVACTIPESTRKTVTVTDTGPVQPPTWPSGVWTGEGASAIAFGQWRGNPITLAGTYPHRSSWAELAADTRAIDSYTDLDGTLVYGLPLVAEDNTLSLADVAGGDRQDVFTAIAQRLLDSGHGEAYVRVGWEANGTWAPWGGTAETAGDFIGSYRLAVQKMRAVAPKLRFVFDISCGTPLTGGTDRMDAFTKLYPGDDVVDVIGCDFYDMYDTAATNDTEWEQAIRPTNSPGLADLVDFAAEHDKKLAVPEWGVVAAGDHGSGDNPYFIRAMHDFFVDNAEKLEFEMYFNEPADYIKSALYDSDQNPKSAAEYRRLWTAGSTSSSETSSGTSSSTTTTPTPTSS